MLIITNHWGHINQNHKAMTLTSIRMATIRNKKQKHRKKKQPVLERMQINWSPYALLVDSKMMQTLWEIVQNFLQKLKKEFPHDPHFSIYQK